MGTGSISPKITFRTRLYWEKKVIDTLNEIVKTIKTNHDTTNIQIHINELERLSNQENSCPKCKSKIYQRKRDGSLICYSCGYDNKSVNTTF